MIKKQTAKRKTTKAKGKTKVAGKQQTLAQVPDISVEYWGTYEVPALEDYSDDEFRDFVVAAYGGRASTAGKYIHGFKREMPLFVGSPKNNSQVKKDDVVNFAQEISETKGKKSGAMIAWSFAPAARQAADQLIAEGNPGVDLIQISLTEIESDDFRKHVTKLHNEYESLLKFILPPQVILNIERVGSMTYAFDASASQPLNSKNDGELAKIVNVQWDFEFLGRFTPTQGFGYGRDPKGNPQSKLVYKFQHMGKTSIACRVQDDLGGEKIHNETISVR